MRFVSLLYPWAGHVWAFSAPVALGLPGRLGLARSLIPKVTSLRQKLKLNSIHLLGQAPEGWLATPNPRLSVA
jgi:hypothetical protein